MTYSQVKVVLTQVTASVGNLHHHLLARDRTTGEGELIALTAPRALTGTGELGGSKAIGEVVVDGPRALVAAGEGVAVALAARSDVRVARQRIVVDVAARYELVVGRLAAPTAGGFATVPVASGLPVARLCGSQGGHVRREADEGGELHLEDGRRRLDRLCQAGKCTR